MAGAERFTERFRRDQSGATAIMFGIGALVLILMTGFGVDYYRWTIAKSETQGVLDGAALSAAASREIDESALSTIADAHVAANSPNMRKAFVDPDYDTELTYADEKVTVTMTGGVPTIFMGLAGVQTMPLNVTAVAQRGEAEAVELVLVLDNTGSMNQMDAGGQTRIAALKAAAASLVTKVKEREEADVKVGVVPYAEYVNVGKANRGQAWLSLEEYDKHVPAKDPGKQADEIEECTAYGPYYTVNRTRQLDGRTESYTEQRRDCTKKEKRPNPNAGKPTGGRAAYTEQFRWEGCVYSRIGDLRLSDTAPMSPYAGIIVNDKKRDCQTEIVPLSDNRATVLSAISGMVTTKQRGGDPMTFIPGGLIWGVNVLSPGAPFTEGRAYGPANRSPRKIMVLMTDGVNTMTYRPNGTKFGQHIATTAAGQLKQTNDDVTAICNYAKSQNIEIYTVALGIEDDASTTMLRGCASQADYFFNASNNAALGEAFDAIAASINRVRLVQ
ncbi:pilus assembly protein [Brevundimonas lutea]|uniref:pilus assembly protein n=1 Tax=Brevundimonas lutea TaxID=2293980 RepID=UPI000F0219E9|nr:pilus assembly protein [Brevundimonas lutea]